MKIYRQRKSPRLQGYDYSQEGAYFVTICTHQRHHLFGYIDGEEMVLNACGEIALARWQAIPDHHGNCELDAFVVMPNHVHGIIIITDNAGVVPTVGTRPASSLPSTRSKGVPSGSLGAIIGSYKSGVTRRIRAHLHQPDWIVWQGRYHDHILRNESDLHRIWEYVQCNPALWAEDVFYADS